MPWITLGFLYSVPETSKVSRVRRSNVSYQSLSPQLVLTIILLTYLQSLQTLSLYVMFIELEFGYERGSL
jgi:hypothetical protein